MERRTLSGGIPILKGSITYASFIVFRIVNRESSDFILDELAAIGLIRVVEISDPVLGNIARTVEIEKDVSARNDFIGRL